MSLKGPAENFYDLFSREVHVEPVYQLEVYLTSRVYQLGGQLTS